MSVARRDSAGRANRLAAWGGLVLVSACVAAGFALEARGGAVSSIVSAATGAPEPVDDAVTTGQDAPSKPIDVLANDGDPNGDRLELISVTEARRGTVQIAADRLVYTPQPGLTGTDSVKYTVRDPGGGTAEAELVVTVVTNGSPLPVSDRVVFDGAEPLTIDPLANDRDADGDALVVTEVGQAAHGEAILVEGRIEYRPEPGFVGIDELIYMVGDPLGRTAAARVAISVPPQACSAVATATVDGDGDGYDNADELAVGSDPCDRASLPPDTDGDGRSDASDPFALDAANGQTIALPAVISFDTASVYGTLFDVGFSGVMANGTDPYTDLFSPEQISLVDGALRIETVDRGDAFAAQNDERNALLFGIRAPNQPFTVQARLQAPFPDQAYQSAGFFIGTGDQDNYVKLVVSAAEGEGGIKVTFEEDGDGHGFALRRDQRILGAAATVDLYLRVDPTSGDAMASYAIDDGEPDFVGGERIRIPAAWLDQSRPLAIGIIATSQKVGPQFSATWDLLKVTLDE